jgi:uncharacterized protein YecT (DUF1311 family)
MKSFYLKKAIIMIVLTLCVFLSVGAYPVFALSDKEYTDLQKNVREFAEADKHLSTAWKALTQNVSENRKSELLSAQREWIKSVRDRFVEYMKAMAADESGAIPLPDAVIKNGKFNVNLAYTRVTEDRALYLEELAKQEDASEYLPSFNGKLCFVESGGDDVFWFYPDGWGSPLVVSYAASDSLVSQKAQEVLSDSIVTDATVTGRLADMEGFDWERRWDEITIASARDDYAEAAMPVAVNTEESGKPDVAAENSDGKTFDSPVPAEVTEEKAFVREDHDNKAKRIATLEEGDGLDLLNEWQGNEEYPWYRIETDEGEGWIYGQVIRRLDGEPIQTPPVQSGEKKSVPEVGILASDSDFVTVIARGQGTDRQKALEQAWIDAVRLAVGTIISSKSELNNDEFAENTVAHSRGVVDSFDIVGEQNDEKRTTVTIQAKVHKEILKDATKIYLETQTVKADAGEAIKVQMDLNAKDTTAEDKQKSGAALLEEVLKTYGKPELFYSATLDPKIYFDEDTRKTYVKIREQFNMETWKEFSARLRTVLDAVAVKKVKMRYTDEVREANQLLAKQKIYRTRGELRNVRPYIHSLNHSTFTYTVTLPDSNAAFTFYTVESKIDDICEAFWKKMSVPICFSIEFLDKDGNEIYSLMTQAICPYPIVYTRYRMYINEIIFAPGFFAFGTFDLSKPIRDVGGLTGISYIALDTLGFEDIISIELDAEDLQQVDSIKCEVVFEQK